MKLALLAPCDASVRLTQSLMALGDYQLIRVVDFADNSAASRRLQLSNAETLFAIVDDEIRSQMRRLLTRHVPDKSLSLSGIEAVILGQAEWENRDRDVREIIQAGIPLIAVHPACEAIVAFELDMIQRDTESTLHPFHPDASHPAWQQLKNWLENQSASPIGNIEQLVLERHDSIGGREHVLRLLSQDAFLLRQLLGDVDQVGAMASDTTSGRANSLANLNVHFRSQRGVLCRWSVLSRTTPEDENTATRRTSDNAAEKLTLRGSDGQASLQWSQGQPWSLQIGDQTQTSFSEPASEHDARNAMIVDHILSGKVTTAPNWEDACRALDLADTASESSRRGKTLTIHNQRVTEEDTFKSIMAVGGCLILMCLPLLLALVSLVEGLQLPSFWAGQAIPIGAASVDKIQQLNDESLPSWLKNEFVHVEYPLAAGATLRVISRDRVWRVEDARQAYTLKSDGTSLHLHLARRHIWPVLVAVPLLAFLLLQTLKLVFPKPARSATT